MFVTPQAGNHAAVERGVQYVDELVPGLLAFDVSTNNVLDVCPG